MSICGGGEFIMEHITVTKRKGPGEPLTNFERIKEMSIDEMSNLFNWMLGDCLGCPLNRTCIGLGHCRETWRSWLNRTSKLKRNDK